MRYALLTFVLMLAAALPAGSQDVVVNVNLRTLHASVEDEQGRPVLDLSPDDFVVFEDGQSKRVAHLSLERQPVAVGLVVDRSSSIAPVKTQLDEAAMHLLEAAHAEDQLFLMTFAGSGRLNVPFTTKHEEIPAAIRKTKLGFGSRLHDVLVDALAYLSTSPIQRKILVVISDGADHYSTHTLEQVRDLARFHGIRVYELGYIGDDSRTWTENGRRELEDQFERLARLTGGKAFLPGFETNCSEAATEILQRSQYEYHIEFYSSNPLANSQDVQVVLRGQPSRRLMLRDGRPIS